MIEALTIPSRSASLPSLFWRVQRRAHGYAISFPRICAIPIRAVPTARRWGSSPHFAASTAVV
jgi:hypothetical protein